MSGAVAALRRWTRPRGDRCPFCALELGEAHEHLVELAARRVECACQACALCFDSSAAQRWRRIGKRVRRVALDEGAWDALDLPVELAFVAEWSASGPSAMLPSALGPVDHPLVPEVWQRLRSTDRALAAMQPDVEALLVDRRGARALVAPIDRCFALIGRMRATWHGPSGGRGARGVIDAFFAELGHG